MLKRTVGAVAAVLLITATAVPAQQRGMPGQRGDSMPGMMGPGMMMGGMMGQGMMGSMTGQGMMGPEMMRMMGQGMGFMATGGPGPGMMLRMQDAMELTDQQVRRLQRIQDDHSGSVRGHMQAALSMQQEAAEALRQDPPDFGAYEDALTEAATHMAQAHVAMARAAMEARDVLTEEQRSQLRRSMRTMGSMMGQPGAHGGMMRGGAMPHR